MASRARYAPEDRRRVLQALSLDTDTSWVGRFAVMLGLSLVVAVTGLLADSPTLVIGAMLIAPLMTPVLGFAVALAMWWPRRMARAGATVVAASVGAVGLSWLLALCLPSSDTGITRELLTRTTPAVLDLLVALAAGAAGAYATVRHDVSSALPGVAVAVALVPPVATVGVTLELNRPELAEGALLLYLVNLVAIVLAGIAVFVVTGFVPLRRLSQVRRHVGVASTLTFVATAALAVPLSKGVRNTVDTAAISKAVHNEVLSWLGDDTDTDVRRVAVEGSEVTVDLVGTKQPPPTSTLAGELVDTLGEDASVEVRWSQRTAGTVPRRDVVGTASPDGKAVEPLVRTWLDDAGGGAAALEVLSADLSGDELVVDLRGAEAPPPARPLATAVASRLGHPVKVTVRWTQQREYAASSGSSPSSSDAALRVRAAAESWAQAHPGTHVLGVAVTGGRATVDLASDGTPSAVVELVGAVEQAIDGVEVVVRLADLRPLPLSQTTTPP